MADYILYLFDEPGVFRCEPFNAPDDQAAIEGALTRHEGVEAELWNGSRKVWVFKRDEEA